MPVRRSTRHKAGKKPVALSAGGRSRKSYPNSKELESGTAETESVAHAQSYRAESYRAEQGPIVPSMEDSSQISEAERKDDINLAFNFLSLEERPGKCQTELGIVVTQTCKKMCALFHTETVSSVAITRDFEELCHILTRVRFHVTKKDYCNFKADAYGHVFRALLLYLKTLYYWFDIQSGYTTDSIEAVRLISSLTQEILSLKDTIASWRVSVPQRYHGDRTFADVDSKLIAPLRRVSGMFRIRLSQLETEEKSRNDQVELEQERRAHVDDKVRKSQLIITRRKRWLHWQNLHILRMQCEPDPSRRRKLVITKFEHFEEKDANGVRFERLSIFKSRPTPPWHWVSNMLEDRDWTDVEDIALLEGLQSLAGTLMGICSTCKCLASADKEYRITCV